MIKTTARAKKTNMNAQMFKSFKKFLKKITPERRFANGKLDFFAQNLRKYTIRFLLTIYT